jgi:hypothetical protein
MEEGVKSWNSEKDLTQVHNCYDYAMDHFDVSQKRKSQPGMRAGLSNPEKVDFTCSALTQRIQADHPQHEIKFHAEENFGTCPAGTLKSALFVDPNKDYHFYRLGNPSASFACAQKMWSHKPGEKQVQYHDGSWNLISNPAQADRHSAPFHYTHQCGFFCMPVLPKNEKFSDLAYTPETKK